MNAELKFDVGKSKQILFMPGMLAPAQALFPLVRYLRENQNEYGVTAIPLGLSIADSKTLVDRASRTINQNLLQHSQPQVLIVFGHSHGGRVACELVSKLKKLSPSTKYIVITAGSPIVKKPDYLPWLQEMIFSISRAYRDWPQVNQPNSAIVSRYVGYYSTNDRVVIPKFAKEGYEGELTELKGLSHHDLISKAKMGPLLLELIGDL